VVDLVHLKTVHLKTVRRVGRFPAPPGRHQGAGEAQFRRLLEAVVGLPHSAYLAAQSDLAEDHHVLWNRRAAGGRHESAGDRQIRRYLAEGLELKGFRQATGSEEADLVVSFSTGQKSRSFRAIPILYQRYDFPSMGTGFEVDTRGTLVVDIIDARSDRLAWHAWTEPGEVSRVRTATLPAIR